MKKVLLALLALALILGCACTALAASVHAYASPTYVRTGPGLDYAIVDKLTTGSYYTWGGSTSYDNRGIAWYDVYYSGGYGWVSSLHADLSDSDGGGSYGGSSYDGGSYGGGSSGGGYSGSGSIDGEIYGNWTSYTYYPTIDSSHHRRVHALRDVNVRSGPGTEYTRVDAITAGDSYFFCEEYAYDSQGVVWYLVHNHGLDGWVTSSYTELRIHSNY